MSGSGISWAICKSAPRSRQITTPVPHHSVLYRPDAIPAAQPTASTHWRHILHWIKTITLNAGRPVSSNMFQLSITVIIIRLDFKLQWNTLTNHRLLAALTTMLCDQVQADILIMQQVHDKSHGRNVQSDVTSRKLFLKGQQARPT